MSDTHTIAKAEAETPSPTSKPSGRIILLSGGWRARIRSVFKLEATIFVSPDGGAIGDILWINVDTPGSPPGQTGMELVRGTAHGMRLDLEGYQTDGNVVCVQYCIRLCGTAEAGEFVGESIAIGWGGAQMSGTYNIVEQRA